MIQNLKDIIFDGEIFMFEKNNEKINKSILGVLKISDNNIINSAILSEKYQTKQLMSLCEFKVDQKWDLIYRATQDGFQPVEPGRSGSAHRTGIWHQAASAQHRQVPRPLRTHLDRGEPPLMGNEESFNHG